MILAWCAGGVCLVAAGIGARGPAVPVERLAPPVRARIDQSRFTARLRTRLADAHLDVTPSAWWLALAMVWVGAAAMLGALGAGGPGAGLVALSLVRGGGWAVLRVRRGRAGAAVEAWAPALARRLAAALDSGHSPRQAVDEAIQAAESAPLAARAVLRRAEAAVALGAEPTSAFAHALTQQMVGGSAIGAVMGALALQGHGASPAVLWRLASLLEVTQRSRRQVRASQVEIRAAASMVPVVTFGIAILVVRSQPTSAGVLAVPVGVMLLGVCAALAGLGVWLVHGLTRV